MSKSITESAAEILAASLGGAKKEPMVAGGAQVQDLGGQTPTTEPEAIGAKASAAAKEAPKPGTQGAPAEGSKKTVAVVNKTEEEQENPVKEEATEEEDLPELTEEEIEEYLNSLSEEELAELAALAEADEDEGEVVSEAKKDEEEDEDEEEDDKEECKAKNEETEPEPELTEEQIAEARKAALKDLVTENMGSCKDDIDALFSGETLPKSSRTRLRRFLKPLSAAASRAS